jgi:hypothetical protein
LKAATRIDWRETDKLVQPVPNVGTACQAGWAFTAVAAIESAAAILYQQKANDNQVSVQHLLDCDITNSGC